MSVAYVIVAHRGPQQLARLVGRLLEGDSFVMVHLDSGLSAELHAEMVNALPRDGRVRLVRRVRSGWAAWGLAEAYLVALQELLDNPPAQLPHHVALMSGQDYLLRPAAAVDEFLDGFADRSFMPTWSLPSRLYNRDGGLYRVEYWHRPLLGRRFHIPIRRRYPTDIKPYGGSAFMALDIESVRELMRMVRERPELVRYHRHVWAPDEHFIQTILQNSKRREHILNEALWHIDWPSRNGAHPRVYGIEDLPQLKAAAQSSSDRGGPSRAKLFARKFDLDRDAGIFDAVDRELLGVDGSPTPS